MKNLLVKFLITIIIIGNFSACNKKNEPEPPQVTNEQHLTNNNWTLHTVETSPVIEGIDPMDFLEDCYVDNIYSFLSGGVLSVDEGPLKCQQIDPQVATGEWKLTQNQQQLELKYASYDLVFKILEISDEQMKVQTTLNILGLATISNLTFLAN